MSSRYRDLVRGITIATPQRSSPEVPRALRDSFREVPVPLEEFLVHDRYLGQPVWEDGKHLSTVQFDALRHLEQIYFQDEYENLVSAAGPVWEPVRFINFAYLEWGKGSGKDHICRLAAARIVYLLLCLGSPQEYFSMPRQDTIHLLNVAASDTQAQRAYFEPLRKVVVYSPWFRDRFKGVSDTVLDGVRLPGQKAIKFDSNIEAISGHSKSATMEGLNLLEGTADEIAGFPSELELKERTTAAERGGAGTAEDVLEMMRTSARTRFPEVFKLAAISFPRYKGDIIQRLVKRGREDNERKGERSRIFVSGPLPTWEVNPRIPSKDAFAEDYDEDPEMAAAKYECRPSFATERFFRHDHAVYAAFGERPVREPLHISYYWGLPENPAEDDQRGWQVRFHLAEDLVPLPGARYALHGDMAVTGDRAGVAMAHVKRLVQSEYEEQDKPPAIRPLVKLDFVTSFEADHAAKPAPREVQLRWYRQLIWFLRDRGFPIARVTFDQWQSEDTLQILRSKGIEAEKESMDRDTAPWENLRDLLYEGRLEGYWRQTVIDELLSLRRIGKKVDHVPGGSKDEADAVAGAALGALVAGGVEAQGKKESEFDVPPPQVADSSYGSDLFGLPDFGGRSTLRGGM